MESVAGFIGGGRGINNARSSCALKPLDERKVSAQVDRRPHPPQPAAGARRAAVAVGRPGHPLRRRPATRQYQYTLLADDLRQLRDMGADGCSAALAKLPELTGVDDELRLAASRSC